MRYGFSVLDHVCTEFRSRIVCGTVTLRNRVVLRNFAESSDYREFRWEHVLIQARAHLNLGRRGITSIHVKIAFRASYDVANFERSANLRIANIPSDLGTHLAFLKSCRSLNDHSLRGRSSSCCGYLAC